MSAPNPERVVLLSGPEDDCPSGDVMRFRLYYEGELRPTQRDSWPGGRDKLAPHKQCIRRKFHRQLRHLWATNQFLSTHKINPDALGVAHPPADGPRIGWPDESKIPLATALAGKYQKFGYKIVPLVRDDFFLLCSLDILFLRREIPGRVIQAGDIDNRIKTLIDTLRAPNSPNELVDDDKVPGPDDEPFYCLLWDDKQVSHLSVETDILLDPLTNKDGNERKVRLIITVDLRPYHVTTFNLSFAGP